MPVKHDMRERERDEEKSEASQKTNGSLLDRMLMVILGSLREDIH